jgi:hypothetical protein
LILITIQYQHGISYRRQTIEPEIEACRPEEEVGADKHDQQKIYDNQYIVEVVVVVVVVIV